MNRILPGDLVTFKSTACSVTLAKSEKQKVRKYVKNGIDFTAASDVEKNRLADMLEESKAVSTRIVYLVVTASARQAFLLKSDTLQFLIAGIDDIHYLDS